MQRDRGRLTGFAVLALAAVFGAERALQANEMTVVASINPVHSLVAGIMQGVAEPVLLVKGAGSPHSYSLRPSAARALDQAAVMFWIGEGLETFLVKPLQALSENAVVVTLSEAPEVRLLPTREGGVRQREKHGEIAAEADGEDDHGGDGAGHPEHEDEHAEHDESEEDAHEHGRFDLHVWLDPRNAGAMVDAIVAALSEVDPDHGAIYQSNGSRLRTRLHELDESLKATLAPVRDRPFVVFHDGYQYFENRYGLNALGSVAVDPGRRPGAQRLRAIRHRLEEFNATCVFSEPQFEPALVETVVEGTSARKGVLDPLGADLAPGADLYFQLMSNLGKALIDCLDAPASR
jgi:zinc transport system substrate-binding protein